MKTVAAENSTATRTKTNARTANKQPSKNGHSDSDYLDSKLLLDVLTAIKRGDFTIRMPVDQISQMGRNTQGVRLIRLEDEQEVATVAKAQKDEEEETSEEVSSEE